MLILNLTNVEKSDIKYTISRFPDGEIQITLGEFSRKDYITVDCRITNADDLFIVMQVADILNRHGVIWNLNIFYLMGMRMDRVMDFSRPFTLKILQNVLESLGASEIGVLEPHSERCIESKSIFGWITSHHDIEEDLNKFSAWIPETREQYQVILPDAGAVEREFRGAMIPDNIVYAEKVRDIKTGEIQSIKIVNPERIDKSKPVLVTDDLCDGGGTFIGLAKEIKKYTDQELNIFVTHMVNPRGVENLSKTFDHVYFTNSYKDWKEAWEHQPTPFPTNVTQINII